MKRLLIVAGLILVLFAGAVLGFIYSGVYDIAATEQDPQAVYWALHQTAVESIEERAPETPAPDLSDPDIVDQGLQHFQANCVQCHGAPGVPPGPFAMGMNPVPPNLLPAARTWQPAEIFRAVKDGIRMTGMPAWEFRLDDEEIWAVVAFVRHMARLSPAEYRQAVEEAGAGRARDESTSAQAAADRAAGKGMPERGRVAIRQYACVSCHEVPGIVGRDIRVGPRLEGVGERRFIAGVLPNTPENMVRWIRRPQEVDPLTAMPDMGVTESDARDIAAYLYSLE